MFCDWVVTVTRTQWIAVGVVVLLLTTVGGKVVYDQTRGLRNNNPGNIRRTGNDTWQGMSATQTDPAFVQFVDMEHGVRAVAITINTYMSHYGINTVRGIITRYAPSSENNTAAYINDVAQRMGVGPDDALDQSNIPALVDAICAHENGAALWALVPKQTLIAGLSLAGIAYA